MEGGKWYPSRLVPDAVEIVVEDVRCLDPGKWLTTGAIDFYLRYLKTLAKFPEEIHFFNAFFNNKLAKVCLSLTLSLQNCSIWICLSYNKKLSFVFFNQKHRSFPILKLSGRSGKISHYSTKHILLYQYTDRKYLTINTKLSNYFLSILLSEKHTNILYLILFVYSIRSLTQQIRPGFSVFWLGLFDF